MALNPGPEQSLIVILLLLMLSSIISKKCFFLIIILHWIVVTYMNRAKSRSYINRTDVTITILNNKNSIE